MRRLLPLPLLIVLALLLFGAWIHWAVLWPGNVGWLLAGEDRGQSALGLAAYLRAGAWPSLHQPLLDAPEGAGLLFTDSIPLLGLVLGPVAALIPGGVQFVGPWLLVCMMLQVGFAWLLVRPHAPHRVAALLATALLAAMPALFNRYGHTSLCAQWLILWALWIYRDAGRSVRPGWWVAVLGIAALIHTYLLVMAASFWAGTLLRLAWRQRWRDAALVAGAPTIVVVAVLAWHGAFAGGYASTGTYGGYPAALDAWWNPANPGYSALLSSSPEDRGRGFEGFNYLGAGSLALVVLAMARRLAGGGTESGEVPLRWLLPGFAVMILVAVGPQPLWRGQPLVAVHMPSILVDALDPVRAAGRLVWPASYVVTYAALRAAARGPGALLLLGGALALQIVDVAPMLAAIRATSAGADDPAPYHRTRDPRWQALVARADAVQFEPAEPFRDLALMEELGWRAVAACRPLRYFYTAREQRTVRARIDADSAAFRAGRIDPARLYVMLDAHVPPILAAKAERIDGVAIIAPTQGAPPPRCGRRVATPLPSSPRSAS
jgi:hypothetical protein